MSTAHYRVTYRKVWPALLAWLFVLPLFGRPTAAQTITIGSVGGVAGTSVWFDVSFDPGGKSIAGTQNDIVFDSIHTPIGTCAVNDQIPKDLAWSFLPDGCVGSACNTIRATIISTTDDPDINRSTGPMLSPIVLYRCRVDIPAGLSQQNYPLTIGGVLGSDPLGNSKPVTGVSGTFMVFGSGGGC